MGSSEKKGRALRAKAPFGRRLLALVGLVLATLALAVLVSPCAADGAQWAVETNEELNCACTDSELERQDSGGAGELPELRAFSFGYGAALVGFSGLRGCVVGAMTVFLLRGYSAGYPPARAPPQG